MVNYNLLSLKSIPHFLYHSGWIDKYTVYLSVMKIEPEEAQQWFYDSTILRYRYTVLLVSFRLNLAL